MIPTFYVPKNRSKKVQFRIWGPPIDHRIGSSHYYYYCRIFRINATTDKPKADAEPAEKTLLIGLVVFFQSGLLRFTHTWNRIEAYNKLYKFRNTDFDFYSKIDYLDVKETDITKRENKRNFYNHLKSKKKHNQYSRLTRRPRYRKTRPFDPPNTPFQSSKYVVYLFQSTCSLLLLH